MAREKREWHPNFLKYMDMIVNHPNYKGLPISKKADVMRAIHPTGWKICQTCGNSMSIYYHYPSSNFVKALYKELHITYTEITHISDIWNDLINRGFSETKNCIISNFQEWALNCQPTLWQTSYY